MHILNKGKNKGIYENLECNSSNKRISAKLKLKPYISPEQNFKSIDKYLNYLARPNIMLPLLVEHYKNKYNIDSHIIQISRYNHEKINEQNTSIIKKELDGMTTKGLIFMSIEDPEHCTAILIHNGKLLQLLNEKKYNLYIIEALKNKFKEKYFTSDDNTYQKTHPQADESSCAILAMKIIKNLLKDNHLLLNQSLYNEEERFFYPHPNTLKHSQSDSFTEIYKNNFPKQINCEELDNYRKQYNKARLAYFALSHSPNFIKAVSKNKI